MNKIKRFNEFGQINESWRQVKAFLTIPKVALELLLNRLIGFVPLLGITYDKLSAKIDTGSQISPTVIKEEPIKLELDDIENVRMRNTLKATGLFNEWYVYTFDRRHENRQPIYLSKDELKLGDTIYGERVSDHNVNREYLSKNKRRLFKKKGVDKFEDIEPQFWVIAAKENPNHDERRAEIKERIAKKQYNKLTKLVNDAIKDDRVFDRVAYKGGFDAMPVYVYVIQEDRVDLMKKLIDGSFEDEDIYNMVNSVLDQEGYEAPYEDRTRRGYKYMPDLVKSEEMRELLSPYIR